MAFKFYLVIWASLERGPGSRVLYEEFDKPHYSESKNQKNSFSCAYLCSNACACTWEKEVRLPRSVILAVH